jgi:type IV secretion system protein VirD4
MNNNQSSANSGGDPSGPILVVVAIAAAIVGGIYAGAQLAALAVHHRLIHGVTTDGITHVVTHLPMAFGNPKAAWPTGFQGQPLTGPIPFWISTVIVWIASAALGISVARLFRTRTVGQERHPRFGAPAWSREATRSDLAPLVVKGPTNGRTIFGISRGRLLATEDRSQIRDNRRTSPRQGDRGGVLVIGPARSGKTVIAIGAILEHDWGPLIASSVKTDLLAATINRRRSLDDVAVFDPLDTAGGEGNVGWSPLARCDSATGAQSVATSLVAAAPIDGSVRNADFWSQHAQRLAWVTLYAAKLGGKTMRDVVLWTNVGHQAAKKNTEVDGTDGASVAIAQILENAMLIAKHRDDAELALSVIEGIWGEADETRSGIYASTQTLFAPWEDTRIAKNSTLKRTVDLDWLYAGNGRRSLYICMPEHPKDALRFAVVFGGLIGALTDEAYARRNRTNTVLPNTLLILDEAGNTAASWLPDLSTTCASVGITLMTFWQSLAQIQHRYGDQTNTLITNHLTKIFFGGISDPMSGDVAAKLSGIQEVFTRSVTSDRQASGARRSQSESSTTTNLIPADLIRQIKPGDALCIHGTLQPIHLQTRRWWKEKDLRTRALNQTQVSAVNDLADRLKPYTAAASSETTPGLSVRVADDVLNERRKQQTGFQKPGQNR